MKTRRILQILLPITLLGLVHLWTAAKAEVRPQAADSEYIIVTYNPPGYMGCDYPIVVHYGGDKYEQFDLKKQNYKGGATLYVTSLLNKLSQDGYSLVTSTTFSFPAGDRTCSQIHCYLKKK